MTTRSIAEESDEGELSLVVWRATGCGAGVWPPEEVERATEQAVWGLGTPGLLRGLWGGAQAAVARDGGPRLHEREIGAVHEARVGAWRRLRDGAGEAEAVQLS